MAEKSYYDDVFEVTRKIPKGKVTTYGAIADYLALGSARMVGWALNNYPAELSAIDKFPAHRVVNIKGELSGRVYFGKPDRMAELLIEEGIEVVDSKIVGLKKYLWKPVELMEDDQTDEENLKTNKFVIESIADLLPMASKIIELSASVKKVFFTGQLGAGKTTLIKLILQELGVKSIVTSPTFSIINEYKTDAETIYHMDLYRIEKIQELHDLGFEEYLNSDAWCFIEWPQIAEPLLHEGIVVSIEVDDLGNRIILLT